jgi:nitroimidazol reductase NimA-like FMN-containing flavoprotein (pyridoxamine 5'-phosphate oxidase superfamily)
MSVDRARQSAGDADGAVLNQIPREECLALLSSEVIARVAVADFNAPPLIVPVNYVMDGDAPVFRTDYGTKFRLAVLRETPVSFEIDGVHPGRRSGWSVLVQGSAMELSDEEATRLRLEPWAPGRKTHWVRIAPESVTGRRIRLPQHGGADGRGYL